MRSLSRYDQRTGSAAHLNPTAGAGGTQHDAGPVGGRQLGRLRAGGGSVVERWQVRWLSTTC